MDQKPLISPRYRQKSKLFLWPLVRLERSIGLRPIQTFIVDPVRSLYDSDYKLIAVFPKEGSVVEEDRLLSNEFFEDFYETEHLLIYVFDLSSYKDDYDRFLEGNYTKFSKATKTLINMYYGTLTGIHFKPHSQIKAYLSPDESVYVKVAKQLDIDVYDLINGVEIVDPPDLEKETFSEDKIIKPTLNSKVPD